MEDWRKKPSPGALAWLVGEALKAGGIQVHQTKEKFDTIRVYVTVPNNHKARMHYREVYLHAKWSCPELADNLIHTADKNEWLYETEKELDEAIQRRVARGGENALDAWAPHFALARKLIRGENTDDFLDGDTEEQPVMKEKAEVTLSRSLFEAAHAGLAWACAQLGGNGWVETYQEMSAALKDSDKK